LACLCCVTSQFYASLDHASSPVHTDDELFPYEAKQVEADDQAIQTILMGLPKDIYAAVDICNSAKDICLRAHQMTKGCSKHMMGNLNLLINFVWKFIGTIRFRNDHVVAILEKKNKKKSYKPKPVPNSQNRLHLLHMDLCGPMRVESINRKRYILVIVYDYSRYTWVHFLRSEDEALGVIIKLLKQIQVLLQALVIINEVVERRNRMLGEAARTMLLFFSASLFLSADAVATVCFTRNQSLIHTRFNKTPYELVKNQLSRFYMYSGLFVLKNDQEDIGKVGAKGGIGFFIGYSTTSYAYRIYNQRTKKVIEIMNVTFDELSVMAFEQRSSKPELLGNTFGHISSGLEFTYAPQQ
nr:hypothetical protein [Tanacetum cinerariifolium]